VAVKNGLFFFEEEKEMAISTLRGLSFLFESQETDVEVDGRTSSGVLLTFKDVKLFNNFLTWFMDNFSGSHYMAPNSETLNELRRKALRFGMRVIFNRFFGSRYQAYCALYFFIHSVDRKVVIEESLGRSVRFEADDNYDASTDTTPCCAGGVCECAQNY